jgi:hypothetical protein
MSQLHGYMGAFKFLESRYVSDALALGRFSIGTLASFRAADGFDDGRSDPREGITSFRPDAGTLSKGAVRGLLRALDREHLMEYAPQIEFDEGSELLIDCNCYLICFVGRLSKLVVRKMAELFGYDACLQILDLPAFCQGLTDADERLIVPFPDHPSTCWKCAPVVYREKDQRKVEEDPLIKHPRYRWQRERRCMWPGAAPHERFLINAPAVTRLVREVDLSPFRRES